MGSAVYSRRLLEDDGRWVPAVRTATDAESVSCDLTSAATGRRLDAGVGRADAESLDVAVGERCSKGAGVADAVERDPAEDDGNDARTTRSALAIVRCLPPARQIPWIVITRKARQGCSRTIQKRPGTPNYGIRTSRRDFS